ncbi:family 20 glycosylhydrolase [Gallaecimonas xiamenensis]|uniref:beta-N-acetylhexosaminidase n=1 Tax=Gallaecimonas xiamenensis 3-C-1 TaxID=745411 RepID=K2JMS9_9GAMM|nr:family 20 glycosylhydrolase [Gallaecimonas xiamenensis]EKE75722.1 beta-hexosaminidase b [Gallaecimonas xiamenensis 3-C-1]
MKALISLLGLLPLAAQALDQTGLERMANNLDVRYEILRALQGEPCDPAFGDGHCYEVRLTLTLPYDQVDTDWQLYLGLVNPVQSFKSDSLRINHQNGDLHQLTAKVPFEKGQPLSIDWRANFWQLGYTDTLPNFYLAAPGLKAVVVKATQPPADAVLPKDELPFVKGDIPHLRTADDHTPVADGQWYFSRYPAAAPAPLEAVLPEPKSLSRQLGEVKATAFALKAPGFKLPKLGLPLSPNGLAVSISRQQGPAESYRLKVEDKGVAITASDDAGAYYALVTLTQLFDGSQLPKVTIDDSPRYPFRGLHLDLARNFLGKDFVLQLIDEMGALKLNKLHLHLADDEGWRLAIPGLPELTRMASKRCHDPQEERCLQPQLGAGPDGAGRDGFLTPADYQDLLRAAQAHHIEVIPSLDMPGHSRAAIRAMEVRFRRLSADNMAGAGQYRLVEPANGSRYQSIQYYDDNTLNPCIDSTYAFTQRVFSAVQAMHQQAGVPLKRYHIGADETAGAWHDSPACKALIANGEIKDQHDLLPYFLGKVIGQLHDLGIEAAAWSDGLERVDPKTLPGKVQSNVWTPLFWGGEKVAHQMANQGFEVVYSFPDLTYLDFPQAPDPQEPGYYWGSRYIDDTKLYRFMPGQLAANAQQFKDRQQNPYQADNWPLEKPANILGLQGQLWTETVRSPAQAWYRLLPRLAVLAEKAWHQSPWEGPQPDWAGQAQGWQRLAATLGSKWLPRWDKEGLHYRLPPVGVQKENGQYHLRLPYPGLTIEVLPQGASQWQQWHPGMALKAPFKTRAKSRQGRPGRAIEISE